MIHILFIVSTLSRTGPTNQLYNLVKFIDRTRFDVEILTLSSEPGDTRIEDFTKLGINVSSLNLSRFAGLIMGRLKVKESIRLLKPDIIHSQGIRADMILSSIRLNVPWLSTARNYPLEDYVMKFGRFKGHIMARKHMSALGKCPKVIACSNYIAARMSSHKIKCTTVRNGVVIPNGKFEPVFISEGDPIFITVGSLIKRKNMALIINAFKRYIENSVDRKGRLIVVGDGPEMNDLKRLSDSEDIIFTGSVTNVTDYLVSSDCFISASRSEGLPNTVLEALAIGVPCLLSDIPAHREISEVAGQCVSVFPVDGDAQDLASIMDSFLRSISDDLHSQTKRMAEDHFSAKDVTRSYQEIYRELLEHENQVTVE